MDVHLAVRWLHVSAAMLIAGGAVLVAALLYGRQPQPRRHADLMLLVADRYERVFWAAFGVLVVTGVGNLGAFGGGLPQPDSEWGRALTLKLIAVLVVAAASAARTLLVAGLHEAGDVRALAVLRASYTATSVLVLGVVGLAEVLAHG